MNSTQRNRGSTQWRKCNGLVTKEEAKQKPCFICSSPFHSVEEQAHCDGWCILAPEPNHTILEGL